MATISKRGKSWFAQVFKNGIRKSKSFPNKGMASAWAIQLENEILTGKYKQGSDKTLKNAIDRYAKEVTPTKKGAYSERYIIAAILKAPFVDKELSEITPEMTAQYRDVLLQTLKPASVQRYLGLMSAIFTQARREWQWIDSNPLMDIRKPQASPARDKIFSESEIEIMLKKLNYNDFATQTQQTIACAFLFALETAMRAGEIVGLEWENIHGNVAHLPKTKNGEKRDVPLSTKALEILESRKGLDKPFSLKPHTLSQGFNTRCRAAGIDATFHDSRHTAITRLAKILQPFDLARMAGHKNMTMTLRYYNESAESIADKLK